MKLNKILSIVAIIFFIAGAIMINIADCSIIIKYIMSFICGCGIGWNLWNVLNR